MQIRSWLLDIESAQKMDKPATAEKRIAILIRRNAQAEWLRKCSCPMASIFTGKTVVVRFTKVQRH